MTIFPVITNTATSGLFMWFRYRLGGSLQRIVWRLCDPHDSWMIEYRGADGRHMGQIITGHYHDARAFCREHRGRILGDRACTIPAGD